MKRTFQYSFKDLNINTTQIEKALGYIQAEPEETIRQIVKEVLEESGRICDIRTEYRIFENPEFVDSDKSVSLGNIKFNIKKIIYGQLKKSAGAALFLCTAGPAIGVESRKAIKEGDLLKGYIFDTIGSEIVETAADLMQDELQREMIASGRNITNRFSPGYCGWDVAEQHKLFMLMPDNYCGISLTPSALMDPEKSISGIIGIGENVKRMPYTCSLCDMKNCIYRRTKS